MMTSMLEELSADETDIYKVLKDLVDDSSSLRLLTFHVRLSSLGSADRRELRKVWRGFPGGRGPFLPSFRPENASYSCFPARSEELRQPYDMLQSGFPPPMIPLACGNSFSSMKEFTTEHRVSAVM